MLNYLRWQMLRLRRLSPGVSHPVGSHMRGALPAAENRPDPGCPPLPCDPAAMLLEMPNLPPELHRPGRRLGHDFQPVPAPQTDLCKHVRAHQAMRGHGQHKHVVHAIEPAQHNLATADHSLVPTQALVNQLGLARLNCRACGLRELIGYRRLAARGVQHLTGRYVQHHERIDEMFARRIPCRRSA